MARFKKVASVLLDQGVIPEDRSIAREPVLREVKRSLDSLRGLKLDLVVLSEQVEACGQSMQQAESFDSPGPVLELYRDFARNEGCTVAGSAKLLEDGHIYNSIVYYGPDGKPLGAYHKTYLTNTELENGHTPGKGAVVVQTPAGVLGGAVCFDLNFETLLNQYPPLKPDIIVFPSMYHGGLMQGCWAYRCRSYFVSALYFHGGGVLDPFGRPMAQTDCYNTAAVATINLDRVMVHLDYNRAKFPEIRRRYVGRMQLDIPPNIGSALITSLVDDLSAMDIVRAYDLTLLDDYMVDARQRNDSARPATPIPV